MAGERIVYLLVRGYAVGAEVSVNDIPLVRLLRTRQKTAAVPLRQYLLPGTNSLSLEAEPGGEPFEKEAGLLVRIAEFTEDDWLDMEGGQELAALRPAISGGAAGPLRMQASFDLPAAPGLGQVWDWAQAPVLTQATTRAAMDAYVGHLAGLFAERNADGLLNELLPTIDDAAAAYPATPRDEMIAAFMRLFAGVSASGWRPFAFDPARIAYRPAAGGRLVELRDPEGQPFLRSQPANPARPFDDPDYRELTAFVGIRDGRFGILR